MTSWLTDCGPSEEEIPALEDCFGAPNAKALFVEAEGAADDAGPKCFWISPLPPNELLPNGLLGGGAWGVVEATSALEDEAGVEGAKEKGEVAEVDGLPRPSFIDSAFGAGVLPLNAPNSNGEVAGFASLSF